MRPMTPLRSNVLCWAAFHHVVNLGVTGIDAAAGKHIRPRRKTRTHRAAGHQHFQALFTIAQQQHRGSRQRCSGCAFGVDLQMGADHGVRAGVGVKG